MVKIKLISNTDSLYRALKILSQEIGRRTYWIHNRVGGPGWSVDLTQFEIEIEDDQLATFVALKLK